MNTLAALMPFLRLKSQGRYRPGFQTRKANRLSGFLTIAVGAFFNPA